MITMHRVFRVSASCAALILSIPTPLCAAGSPPADTARIDLEGNALPSAPNATLPREGKPPAILSVTAPNLQLHRTAVKPSKGTILLFPGGGYHLLAVTHEGLSVADLLNASGYDAAILEYSVGEGTDIRPKALADAIKAADLIRNRGAEFGLTTSSLGVMGFSAGGHLAARLVHESGVAKPFATITLIYPAYLEGSGSLNPDVAPPPGITSRVFVLIGDQDKPEWVAGARAYVTAAQENHQEGEFHLLSATKHGFGIQPGQVGVVAEWPALLVKFLAGAGG